MEQAFELVRRVPGGRIFIRNAFGQFKETGFSEERALEIAEGNSPEDIAQGLYSADEVTEFTNPAFDGGGYEEIPLDEIEVDTDTYIDIPEDVPLLEGAVGAGTAGAVGSGAGSVGAGTVATGLGTVIATVGIGTAVTLLSGKKDYTVPGRPNTGPGNEPAEPTSNSDRISLHHDGDYANARSQDEVRAIDDTYLHEQLNEFSNPDGDHINAAIGIAGIGGKRVIESAIGVQYPPNLPVSVSGESKCHVEIVGNLVPIIGLIRGIIGMI